MSYFLGATGGFNSRSREGSDSMGSSARVLLYVSIHAPVKGATVSIRQMPHFLGVSIHAPVKGATFEWAQKIPSLEFQFTLP